MKPGFKSSTDVALALALGLGVWAGSQGVATADPASIASPFAKPSTLPFHAPRFDLIKDSDFQPAFDEGMRQQLAEIDAIANSPAAPTFANTIVAMERSGAMLDRVSEVFDGLNEANTNAALQKIDEIESAKRAAHHDATFLNAKLFARVQTLWNKRDHLKLDQEQQMLLKVYYDGFIQSGAKLSAADQTKLRALNTQISSLETAFQQKLLAAAKAGALVVDDKAALAGLSPGAIDSAAAAAEARGLKGKWVIPLQNTTQQPSLESLDNRATREALFNNGWTRAEKGDANDTRATISKLAQLRAEKAQLLGFATWADYVLQDQMAQTPKAVETFLNELTGPARAESIREAADIQAVIDKEGGGFKLKPWDWDHYAEKVRKARYDLDQNEVKPYFELHKVLEDGVFFAANRLYGLTFKKRTDIPTYNPDVMVYEVTDKTGKPLGLMYFDYFKRDNKSGGGWMSNFVGQSKLMGAKPVIYNVANFTKPAAGQPALISSDEVITMFNLFGYALYGLLADQEYPTGSGTNVARDFVAFPAQFNEHWALDPLVIKHYAVHYKTGAPLPQDLVNKIKKAQKFNQGYGFGEFLASMELDMHWHDLPASAPQQDVDDFEATTLKNAGADFPEVPPRYRSSYFHHIWDSGYSAGYYAYVWAEMLDDDAFAWFEQHGGLTRKNGQRFRDMILSRGHTLDYGPMFKAFYGKDPDIGPLLEHRGLPTKP